MLKKRGISLIRTLYRLPWKIISIFQVKDMGQNILACHESVVTMMTGIQLEKSFALLARYFDNE